jgi:hypothetical protein
MRYMSTNTSEEPGKKQVRWRKCPICEDSIYLTDVRPARLYAGQECALPRKGDDVILRLMMRTAKSTLALPKEGAAEVLQSGDEIPWHFAANVMDYARIMRGTSGYMAEQFDDEVEELLKQEQQDELLYDQDNEWTQKAIRAIKAAKEKTAELGEAEKAAALAGLSEPDKSKQVDQNFYFYSSLPHLYLSPLDIRILKTKYGSFSAFPSTLLPRVERISTGHVVDDALRKRAKYLGHLPRGCLISFLECDWADIVPPEILSTFSEEIERRRGRDREKATQEERERIQAERRGMATFRDVRRMFGVRDEGAGHFGNSGLDEPPVNMNDFIPLGGAEDPILGDPDELLTFLSEMSTTPSGLSSLKTVWGTPLVEGSKPEALSARHNADDGWLKDDAVLETLGGADMAQQLEALGVETKGESSANAADAAPGGGGGKKKKKKQKITLMSTGSRRAL